MKWNGKMNVRRTVFFISDRTGITAETLGQSLLTQFDHIEFDLITLPFIDTSEKARNAVIKINSTGQEKGIRPIVFSTLIDPEIRVILMTSNAAFFDFFETFISPLESELSVQSSHVVGRYHSQVSDTAYQIRIDAVNYALQNDDGISTKDYDQADVILVGVSRSGKTPTCLYLGLQFGIRGANYPLTEENLLSRYSKMPDALEPYRKRLYGLSINPERLQKIRGERRPDSRYASLKQCQIEVFRAESLFYSENIPFLNTTMISVEEIAATIMHEMKLVRRVH
jgi:hypothetical protein